MAMTPQEFSARIKQKYPQYQNIDDVELARRIVEKHPQYQTQVSFDGASQTTPETPKTPTTTREPISIKEGLGRILRGAGREIKGVAKVGLAAGRLAGRGVAAGLKSPFERYRPEDAERYREELKQFKKQTDRAVQAVPGVAEELVEDFVATFGIAPDPESTAQVPVKFDKQVLVDKWLDSPIESTLDAFFVGGIATKLAKGGLSAAARAAAQKDVKKIMSKKDLQAAEFAKIAGTEPAAKMERLYRHTDALDDLSIKQLNSDDFGEGLGKLLIDDLRRLKKREQIKLDSAIKQIKDTPIDKELINRSIGEELLEAGLVKQTDRGLEIVSTIDVPKVTRELKLLQDPATMTAAEMKKHLNTIDKITKFTATDEVNDALKIIRRGFRQELRRLSPKYDETALAVSKKLDLLDENVRRIEKAGAGERMGQRILGTKEEQDLFKDLLTQHPDKLAGKVQASLEARSAWVAWNDFFRLSGKPIGRVPIVPGAINVDPGTVLTPLKKRLAKTKIKLKRLGLKPPMKKKTALRGALEVQDIEEQE